MNYGLALSLKMEKHLEDLVASASLENSNRDSLAGSANGMTSGEATQYGIQYQNHDGAESVVWGHGGAMRAQAQAQTPSGENASLSTPPNVHNQTLATWGDHDFEEKALSMAIEEVWEEDANSEEHKWPRPWAANGKSCRIGEIVLLVDSDTIVPEDCLRDAAREMNESPTVAIIQHESDVMQVANHYFENGIAYFTRRINRCISICEFCISIYSWGGGG